MIIYKFIKYLILYLRRKRILLRVYRDENLEANISNLFECKFHTDNAARMYAIINPLVKNGKFTPNVEILEWQESGRTNTSFVEKWIMERLLIAQKFISANNLFDLVTYTLKRLDNYDNHLFVIEPIYFKEFSKWLKIFLGVYVPTIIAGVILLIIFL